MWNSVINGLITALVIIVVFRLTGWDDQPFATVILLAAGVGLVLGLLQGLIGRAMKSRSGTTQE